jgi:predicted TIM-barrel fold metal-dependent hydrolase
MNRFFDFHARLLSRPGSAEQLLSTMDRHGIARAAVAAGGVVDLDRLSAQLVEGGHVEASPDNESVLDACLRSHGRLLPFWFANPYEGEAAYRKQAHHFRGLELSPAVHGTALHDPRVVALVRVAAEVGHPVYTVCTGRAGARAGDLVRLARRFPTVPFVFGHCGFTGIDTNGINQIARQENVHAETSGCFTVTARIAVDRLGPDRVLFGTEFPLQDPGVELAKYAALGLDPGAFEKVAWRNAHRLLREDLP